MQYIQIYYSHVVGETVIFCDCTVCGSKLKWETGAGCKMYSVHV